MGTFVAIDLGASNGRVVVGRLKNSRLTVKTVHRFEHTMVRKDGHLRWRWLFIRNEILKGLTKAVEYVPSRELLSVSCSSWAQDFGCLDRSGNLLFPPISYRDGRTAGLPGLFVDRISADDLIKRVGSTIHPTVTLCQLYALSRQEPSILKATDCILHVADMVHYELCAEKTADWTLATASQLLNLKTCAWDTELMEQLDIPHHFLPETISFSRHLGSVKPSRLLDSRLNGLPVVVSAGHDTAAATAVIPSDKNILFISSGTWSMMGCVTDEPFITAHPSNHGCAVFGLALRRWGLVKGCSGWWLLQECLRILKSSDLTKEAAEHGETQMGEISAQSVINPEDPRFIAPSNMIEEIRKYCRETGQQVPLTFKEIIATILTSMVFNYRVTAELIENLTGRRFTQAIIFGGGSRNTLFCQMAADALEIPVITGPPEATSVGNIMIQSQLAGVVEDDKELWQIVADSFPPVKYFPQRKTNKQLYSFFVNLKENFATLSKKA